MTVLATSREAFKSVDLTARQADVMRALEALWAARSEPCDQDIAGFLDWPINRVTPRRGELEALGLIVRGGIKRGPSGRKTSWWRRMPRQPGLGI